MLRLVEGCLIPLLKGTYSNHQQDWGEAVGKTLWQSVCSYIKHKNNQFLSSAALCWDHRSRDWEGSQAELCPPAGTGHLSSLHPSRGGLVIISEL